jgi:hypothetical protein
MSEEPLTTIQCEVEFPQDQTTLMMDVVKVGDRLYRLQKFPVGVESVNFADIVEADMVGDRLLRVQRVVEKSRWLVYDFILSEQASSSSGVEAVLERVTQLGGHWEKVFGGVLIICLPPEVHYDPTVDVMREQGI